MDDLIVWLNAQIDDDEDAALGAKGDSSGVWADAGSPVPPDGVVLYDSSGRLTVGQHRHMVRNDPDRVLRQVAAYRKLLAWHSAECTTCMNYVSPYCDTTFALAEIYSDRHGRYMYRRRR